MRGENRRCKYARRVRMLSRGTNSWHLRYRGLLMVDKSARLDGVPRMPTTRAKLLSLTMSAIGLASLLALPVAAQGEPPSVPSPDAPSEQSQQDDPAADKAQAEAEKQQQREAEKANAEAENSSEQREAEKAQAEAEKQQQREAEKANAEAEKQQQREAEKAQAEAEKQQQREADKAQAEAEKQQQREAEKANAEAEQQQQREAERANAEAEQQQQQGEAEKAQAEAEQQKLDAAKAKQAPELAPQIESDADKATPSAKPNATGGKPKRAKGEKAQDEGEAAKAQPEAPKANGQEQQPSDKATQATEPDAEKGTAEAHKQKQLEADKAKADADGNSAEARKTKAGGDKQQQRPSEADRTGRGGSRGELRLDAKNETQAAEQLKQERVKADDEFEKAKREAEQSAGPKSVAKRAKQDRERRSEGAENEFLKVRKQRQERVEDGGRRAVIEEPDKRVIVIEKDRSFVRHDETRRFARTGKTPKRERRKDGTILSIYVGFGGVEILNLEDEEGRLLRRSRRGADGREIVLVDNRRFYSSRPRGRYYDAYVDLAPPVVRIPRDKYILEYEEASEEDIYEALNAPPIERLQRGYALEEVRQSRGLRERMRRVDLNAISFAFASWEVAESQYSKLERVADAMRRILKRNPDEMFLIEGHTDAVGSEIDNLSLSDRRAESVAIILSDTFRVPPENLATQGYGEQYLKVPTDGPLRANRRVAVRRITPLLSRSD